VDGDHREQPRAQAATHEQRLVVECGGVSVGQNGAQPGGMLPDAAPALLPVVSAAPPSALAAAGVAWTPELVTVGAGASAGGVEDAGVPSACCAAGVGGSSRGAVAPPVVVSAAGAPLPPVSV
jgi:hypothetical protein